MIGEEAERDGSSWVWALLNELKGSLDLPSRTQSSLPTSLISKAAWRVPPPASLLLTCFCPGLVCGSPLPAGQGPSVSIQTRSLLSSATLGLCP